ncbi:DHA2 family efflux MFS transporter permease subunit [Paenibacillus arenilitoris]|uniref:DHA2 family efflux MFS transporter permease subunit n=1 Tax=Paenibacillus arenilitoris TaxID=2772299 RepID=A0A927H9I2_9BACL|nr:DHA2 family efflux MFS transporter permease subunit [Paenibacillus arenilitoris]MBD2872763.1 DHA2 family efflux MFS transporter permease subunit [Paenibacillus arenilitoris]
MNQEVMQKVRFWPVMLAIFIGSFLCVLASASINLALEIFTVHFHTTLSSVQWTLTGFMLAMGTTAPIAGYLGERFSYRRLYLFSLIGFTVTSILCASAWNEGSLILFRVLQGAFSGLIIPATMSIIYQIIPRERQAMAIAFWGLSAMLAPAFGPTISGWVLQNWDWQWLFLMNIPIGLIAIAFVYAYIPYYRLNVPKSFDLLGFLTVIVSSSSLLLALGQGHAWGWSSWKVLTLFAVGGIALILFVWRELTAETPLLNLKVFKNGRFTLNAIIANIITISLYSGTLLTPVFLQRIQHVSAMDTGMILLPASLAMALLMPFVGKLYGIIGPRWLMASGILLLTIGTLALSWLSLDVSHSYVIWWMTVRNIGIAFVVMPSSNAAMEQIPAELSGHASAISNWTRNVFGSFAIAIFTTMLASRSVAHATDFAMAGDTDRLHIEMMSFTMSVNDVYVVATLVAAVALPLSLFVGKVKQPKGGKAAEAGASSQTTVSEGAN